MKLLGKCHNFHIGIYWNLEKKIIIIIKEKWNINYDIVISYCRQLEEGWMKFGNLRILKTQKPQKLK